jgi:hypothetical protein
MKLFSSRKQWYELFDYNTSISQHNLSQLTLWNCFFSHHQSCIDHIRFVSSLTQITCLRIAFPQFSIDMLVQFLNLLPYLDSLTVIHMLSNEVTVLTEEKIDTNNKITKVNIESMAELNEVDILINLCPHMEYLQVKCRTSNDLELIIYLISTRRNMNYIPHLHSLCLWLPEANDQMVKQLQTKIDVKKLLVHYTIKRICDKIYLQWIQFH